MAEQFSFQGQSASENALWDDMHHLEKTVQFDLDVIYVCHIMYICIYNCAHVYTAYACIIYIYYDIISFAYYVLYWLLAWMIHPPPTSRQLLPLKVPWAVSAGRLAGNLGILNFQPSTKRNHQLTIKLLL